MSRAFRPRSDVGLTLVAKCFEGITLAALVVAVPRVLGPADYGEFAVAFSTVMLLSASMSLGGPTLLSRYVPAAGPEERLALARGLAGRLWRVRLLQTTVILAVAVTLSTVASDRFPWGLTSLVVAAVALDSVATLGTQILLGLGSTGLFSFRYPIQNAVLLLAVLGLHEAWGTTGAVAGICVSAGLTAALAVLAVVRHLHGVPPAVSLPAGALRFGVLQTIGGALVQLVHRGTVVGVVLLSGSSLEAGFAALASGVSLAVVYVVAQAYAVELPRLVARLGTSPAEVERSVRRMTWRSLGITAPMAIAVLVAVESALPHVLGAGFTDAIPAFGPALAVIPLASVSSAASQLAALRLVPGRRVVANAAGGVAFLCAAVTVVPPWGSVGGTAALYVATLASLGAWVVLLPGLVDAPLLAATVACSFAVIGLAVAY